MIAAHQRLKEHSKFLFIPGPDDIGDFSNYSVLLYIFGMFITS